MVHIPFSRSTRYVIDKKTLEKKLKKERWVFSKSKVVLIANESASWERHYLPVSVKDKVVLDVGAGEGETARFFLDHGAAKIICIEPEPIAAKTLEVNAFNHPGKIQIYPKFFELKDLSMKHDFMKMDIEGYEESLLGGKKLATPAVIEVHGLQLRDKFKKQNYRIDNTPNVNGISCISFAYWKC
jgi:hypothetical protein